MVANWFFFYLEKMFLRLTTKHSTLQHVLSYHTHLSGEMLQSMTVLLLVFITRKGSCIVEFKAGAPWVCCSFCWFLWTKFLKAICCRRKWKLSNFKTHNQTCPRLLCQKMRIVLVLDEALRSLNFSITADFDKQM